MLSKIQLQTMDGVREYLFVPDNEVFRIALDTGEIGTCMEIVYRQYIVYIQEDTSMLIMGVINPAMMVSPPGGTWTFTFNGGPMQG